VNTTDTETRSIEARLVPLEDRVAAGARAKDRGEVENLFSTHMYLHNAFRDEEIIPLWVKPGTSGIRAQYSNAGVYTTWESVTEYHRGRPAPKGKLILHCTTTPVIDIAGDDETAKGLWTMTGLESGLTDPEVAEGLPGYFFTPGEVDGKKVWAHWVWCKYGVDFLKQDGAWRIWHFRCFEVARPVRRELDQLRRARRRVVRQGPHVLRGGRPAPVHAASGRACRLAVAAVLAA
jgi:hypothetical protein